MHHCRAEPRKHSNHVLHSASSFPLFPQQQAIQLTIDKIASSVPEVSNLKDVLFRRAVEIFIMSTNTLSLQRSWASSSLADLDEINHRIVRGKHMVCKLFFVSKFRKSVNHVLGYSSFLYIGSAIRLSPARDFLIRMRLLHEAILDWWGTWRPS